MIDNNFYVTANPNSTAGERLNTAFKKAPALCLEGRPNDASDIGKVIDILRKRIKPEDLEPYYLQSDKSDEYTFHRSITEVLPELGTIKGTKDELTARFQACFSEHVGLFEKRRSELATIVHPIIRNIILREQREAGETMVAVTDPTLVPQGIEPKTREDVRKLFEPIEVQVNQLKP